MAQPHLRTPTMNLIVALLLLVASTQATNITEEASTNKTKRTIPQQQVQNFENRPVVIYGEATAPVPPPFYKPVFDPELPKQVAAQQVLYEFQQTPTNAVSNVHVNQYYQPVPAKPEGNTGPAQFGGGSETVATPVQHSSLVRHGQNFAQVQFHPAPHHVQTQQYVPGKYLYVNGKIVYQPGHQPKPVNYVTYTHPQLSTQKFLPPNPYMKPFGYRKFQPPQPHQIQPITKPVNTPEVVEEQKEEEPKEVQVKPKEKEEVEEEMEEEEEEEEEDNEEESYEDDDNDKYFSKYAFEDDDDDDSHRYRDEDEEDNERVSSKTVSKKQKKKANAKPNKYKSTNYNYSSSSKYEKPTKKSKKVVKANKTHKSAKQSKQKGEKIEGKQSQNVPVVHKHKVFKEKWYVTKTDDSIM